MRLTTHGVRGRRPRNRGSAACARASALRAAVSMSPRARKNAAGSPRSRRRRSGSVPRAERRLADARHLGVDARQLVEPDAVDLRRRQLERRVDLDQLGVAGRPAGDVEDAGVRLVAGARQDLRAQQRAVPLERRTDGGGDRGVDRARERQPLGRRPVRVRAPRPARATAICRRASPADRPAGPARVRISSAVATFPAARPRRRLALSWSMYAPIFSMRATSFQPSAGVRAGCSSGRRMNATCVPSRASTAQSSSAQLPKARPASISPSSSDRVTRSAPDSAAAGTASTRARSADSAAISRSRAAGVLSGSLSSNRRSPISVACSGCACRCASQYRVASAASACGGAIASVGSTGGAGAARLPSAAGPPVVRHESARTISSAGLANARVTGRKT